MSNWCPQCQSENREKARFCAECGAPLTVELSAQPAPDSFPPLPAPLLDSGEGAPSHNGAPAITFFAADTAHQDGAADQHDAADDAANDDAANDAAHQQGAAAVLFADEGTAAATDGELAITGEGHLSGCEGFLLPGALIAGRFYVLAQTDDPSGPCVVQVEDRGVCRVCGSEVTDLAEEPYCSNCGVHLPALSSAWPICLLLEVAPPAEFEQMITWEGRTFVKVDEFGDQAADEVSEPAPSNLPAAGGCLNSPALNLLVGQRSHVGTARAGRNNEDSLFSLTLAAGAGSSASLSLGLYLVADGMGGHMDGDIASRTACAVIREELFQSCVVPALQGMSLGTDSVVAQMQQAIEQANNRIRELAAAGGSNMGTTAVLALVVGDRLYVANVGDSRAYLWSREGLRQITEDHSHVFTLKKKGVIEEEEIYTHPRRNEIYRSLGFTPAVKVDCFQEFLAAGDLLLLCSDGLWEMLRTSGIADVLMLNLGDPQVICDELVNRANAAGGDDNISVVVVRAMA